MTWQLCSLMEQEEGLPAPQPPEVVATVANNDCGEELTSGELGPCAALLSRVHVRDKGLLLSLVGQLPDVLRAAHFSMFTGKFKVDNEACRTRLQRDLCQECAAKSGLCGPAAREDPEGLSLLPDEQRVLDAMVRATNTIRERRPFRHNPARPPKLAYVVFGYDDPGIKTPNTADSLVRLLAGINHPDDTILVHIDGESSPPFYEAIENYTLNYDNVNMVRERFNTSWGGMSLVWIDLATMAEAIERDAKWEFFINLSGADYPIKTHKEITQFLGQNRGRSFIDHTYPTTKLPETAHSYYLECAPVPVQVNRIDEFLAQFPSGTHVNATVPLARGEHWFVLSREFCEWLVSSSTVREMLQWGKHILIPDEYFINTAAVQ